MVGQGRGEPGTRERPFVVGGSAGQPRGVGRLLHGKAGKHPRLHDPGGSGLRGGQALQSVMQLQEPLIGGGSERLQTFESENTAPLKCLVCSSKSVTIVPP